MTDRLIKTDRNGTKTYASCRCPRCGGTGKMPYYIENGVCFRCGGSGTVKEYHYRVMTPEYAAKLAEKRNAKYIAQADERNAKLYKLHGMDEDGRLWIVAGNTYEIRDQLKAEGAKYDALFGWHFAHETDRPSVMVDIAEIAEKNEYGDWILRNAIDIEEIIGTKLQAMQPAEEPAKTGEYVGNVGGKIEAAVTLARQVTYETHFTYRGETNYIYIFTDDNGNTIVWKTSAWQDIDEGQRYAIRGTVKEHNEYKGTKQTILTRCKITK